MKQYLMFVSYLLAVAVVCATMKRLGHLDAAIIVAYGGGTLRGMVFH